MLLSSIASKCGGGPHSTVGAGDAEDATEFPSKKFFGKIC